jgi:acetyltransferase-like isoleucine patch superfamily enzyme
MDLLVNKFQKLIQCIRYRRIVLGKIGKHNDLRPGILLTSTSIIGNYNHIGDRVMIGNATIGNYCSIAPDVKIGQSHHSIDYVTTSQKISSINIGYSLLKKRAIIENDVWIGANAVVMQGVTIGTGSVVGANAVVTKDIPPYSVAVGIPAHVIRKRFNDQVIDSLLFSKWWENDLQDALLIVKRINADLNIYKGD